MWALAFNSGFGIINTLLRKVGLIREGIQWLTDPTLAINAVAFAQVWTSVPLVALFLLASLQTIPLELYQAEGFTVVDHLWSYRRGEGEAEPGGGRPS